MTDQFAKTDDGFCRFDIFDDDLPFEEAWEAERQKALALRRMWTNPLGDRGRMMRLPKVKLKHSPRSEYCSGAAGAFRLVCPGCRCSKLVNCQFDRSEAMDMARAHFDKCRPLFDLRCQVVPQLTVKEWAREVR